jgi:hypothetical protein
MAMLLAFLIGTVRPASAQVTFGSPADPPRIALGAGAFNVLPDTKKNDSRTAVLLWGEYRFGDLLWVLAPFLGASGTGDGAFYGYFGFGFDINFGSDWVLTPSLAGGYFYRGDGLNLGSLWEFRSGAEVDYRFEDLGRLGIAFYHMSNAGLGRRNPGAQSLTLVYTVPLR